MEASRRESQRRDELLTAKALLRGEERAEQVRKEAHASLGRLSNVRFGEQELEELYKIFEDVKEVPEEYMKDDNAPQHRLSPNAVL